ncbi:MAG: hypothetical protein AVDCRST_MAG40-3431 [uncultured Gemmatimonadaceae bacterium]|uniref:Uncharacterized protein n=1 Tax=uncultured Gemmatimonadaceae bacterium TaxID=246130 RepID=A0A6J4MKP6_9BACT|nr:MAG: hypothetical protein AVDCRST_MAG40-3431 [uncultured Gemmatimonadaceae bacterium]
MAARPGVLDPEARRARRGRKRNTPRGTGVPARRGSGSPPRTSVTTCRRRGHASPPPSGRPHLACKSNSPGGMIPPGL